MTYEKLQRVAMGFILENEMWPIFLAWCQANYNTAEMAEWLQNPNQTELRREWMRRSEDEFIRAMADTF